MTRLPKTDIERNLMPVGSDLRSVMTRLNEGILGAVFLVDEAGVMNGVITDGNIRRALLSGSTLDTPAADAMTRNFISGSSSAERSENLKLLTQTIRHLPVLNTRGQPVDMLSWAELWRVPVSAPSLGGNELKYVSDAINTNWVSSQGQYIVQFEQNFASYVGAEWAVAVSNGTCALHLALLASRVGAGDEVIVPDLTFGASANAVIHAGAKPVFVDVDAETWCMDPAELERAITPRTKAIMPVHLYGHPADMDPILAVARKHNLKVVEDCAESLGARYKGRQTGTIGDLGCFSFFANKVITTGEGGMITGNDPKIRAHIELLRDHGMTKSRRYWHLEPGFNYRLTNIQAAIGLAQLEQIDRFLERRRACVDRYRRGLSNIEGIALPGEAAWAESIFWLYCIRVTPNGRSMSRDILAARLQAQGVDTRQVFPTLHGQPAFRDRAGKSLPSPIAEELAATGLCLPMSNDLTTGDVDEICRLIRDEMVHSRLVLAHSGSSL